MYFYKILFPYIHKSLKETWFNTFVLVEPHLQMKHLPIDEHGPLVFQENPDPTKALCLEASKKFAL
jgi:hypothetical protein